MYLKKQKTHTNLFNISLTLVSLFILFVTISLPIEAREHTPHIHDHMSNNKNWINLFGNFHIVILHFPIALIIMTGIAELLARKKPSSIFYNAARFMVFFSAITAIPTALLGLAYGYGVTYEGLSALIFWWHRFSGLTTAILAIITVCLKELQIRKNWKGKYYGVSLIILIIFVTVAGFLGGEMTFGFLNLFS